MALALVAVVAVAQAPDYALGPGDRLTGPAIVEERESTAIIGPGGHGQVDDGLALIVEMPS